VTPAPAVLQLEGLDIGHGGRVLLRGIDLEVTGGQIVSVLGANGAGKSTLLKTIMGTLPVLAGGIRLGGASIGSWSIRRRVRAGIGFSPEGRRIFPSLTVAANLLVGAAALPGRREREGLATVTELFPQLAGRMGQRAGTLSGGEQQMLAIGRALMGRPRVLLVEEPSQGLAPAVLDRVYTALRAAAEAGVAVLVAEQFQQLRPGASDLVLAIGDGRIAPHRPGSRPNGVRA
jgi:ABC-type branched-subunit amino acid transport system ATPase component